MQIILHQDDIEKALDTYVRSIIDVSADQMIQFDLKAAGRGGGDGFTATLEIIPTGTQIASKAQKETQEDVQEEPAPKPKAPKVKKPKVEKVEEEKPEELPEPEAEPETGDVSTEDQPEESDEAPVKRTSIFSKA